MCIRDRSGHDREGTLWQDLSDRSGHLCGKGGQGSTGNGADAFSARAQDVYKRQGEHLGPQALQVHVGARDLLPVCHTDGWGKIEVIGMHRDAPVSYTHLEDCDPDLCGRQARTEGNVLIPLLRRAPVCGLNAGTRE